MKATTKQIENAKRAFENMIQYKEVSDFNPQIIGTIEAERRCEWHNNIVNEALAGNEQVINEWMNFFLVEQIKADQKAEASKAKLAANKEASADILAPIKEMKKIGEFGKWLNTSGNPFRKQHFNKKYTVEAVNEFLKTV
jgi:hypothetical protein